MKGKFAKLFDLKNGEQVVIHKDFDSEEECDQITILIHFDGVNVSAKLGYNKPEEREKAFEKFDLEQAEKTYSSLHDQFFSDDDDDLDLPN